MDQVDDNYSNSREATNKRIPVAREEGLPRQFQQAKSDSSLSPEDDAAIGSKGFFFRLPIIGNRVTDFGNVPAINAEVPRVPMRFFEIFTKRKR
jgi:hypothetical protein